MRYSHQPLVTWTDKGLYCSSGGFYIDPHRAVELAIVTHAHSDHARRGNKKYICAASGAGLLRTRLGPNIHVETWPYGEVRKLGDVFVSLHPAGHILGSAQVRIQRGGDVWVASGDYKRDADPSCEPFESVPCDTFISEATFGTPRYRWDKNVDHGEMIARWWDHSRSAGKNCVLFGYSLGKAQRILAELAPHATRPVLIHGTMKDLTECYRQQGRRLAPTESLQLKLATLSGEELLSGELILAPPSVVKDFGRQLGRHETAFASGWMQGQGDFRSRSYDRGFVMSDHADWDDLNRTILETGAKRVFIQHRSGALIRHLRGLGISAHPVEALTPATYPFWGGETQLLL